MNEHEPGRFAQTARQASEASAVVELLDRGVARAYGVVAFGVRDYVLRIGMSDTTAGGRRVCSMAVLRTAAQWKRWMLFGPAAPAYGAALNHRLLPWLDR